MCLLGCLYIIIAKAQLQDSRVDSFFQTTEAARQIPASAFDIKVMTGAIITPPEGITIAIDSSLKRNDTGGAYESGNVMLYVRSGYRERFRGCTFDVWIDGQKIKSHEAVLVSPEARFSKKERIAMAESLGKRMKESEAETQRRINAIDEEMAHEDVYTFLVDFHVKGQRIEIFFHDKNGSELGEAVLRRWPEPVMVTPFFRGQQKDIIAWTERKVHHPGDTLAAINWDDYGLLGPLSDKYSITLDTPDRCTIPDVLDIEKQHQPIFLLMGSVPDTIAYEYRLYHDYDTMHPLSSGWIKNKDGDRIIELPELEKGEYHIAVRYTKHNSACFTYNIILRRSYRNVLLVVMAVAAGLLLIAGSYILRQKIRFRRRERKLRAERQLADLQN